MRKLLLFAAALATVSTSPQFGFFNVSSFVFVFVLHLHLHLHLHLDLDLHLHLDFEIWICTFLSYVDILQLGN